jgi:hypothetical protein
LTHGVLLPLIVPGCAGIDITVTPRLRAAEVPHTFEAVTLIVPLLGLAVARMELVVAVPPVQAAGRLQL